MDIYQHSPIHHACVVSTGITYFFRFKFCFFWIHFNIVPKSKGRAIVQAVTRRFPTAKALVGTRARSCGIRAEQSGTGVDLFRALWFPLPPIPLTAPHSSSIIQGWYHRPNSGRSTKWTQSHTTPNIYIYRNNIYFSPLGL
jgi:hypothetical protein